MPLKFHNFVRPLSSASTGAIYLTVMKICKHFSRPSSTFLSSGMVTLMHLGKLVFRCKLRSLFSVSCLSRLADFQRRFVSLLAYQFSDYTAATALQVLQEKRDNHGVKGTPPPPPLSLSLSLWHLFCRGRCIFMPVFASRDFAFSLM